MRPMQSLLELRAMEADFGVIPTPLMTEEQENYSTSIGYTVSPVCCIPAVVSDLELSAAAIDLLSAESYYSLNEIFYEVLLNTKILRDDESKICLDMIYENRLCDPGCATICGYVQILWLSQNADLKLLRHFWRKMKARCRRYRKIHRRMVLEG